MLQSYEQYLRFRDKLDTLTAEAWTLYQDQMQCRAGCSACCRSDFRISLIEALSVRQAVAQLPAETRTHIHRNLDNMQPERCPLLVDDRCSIYADRPILCRVFGFPMTDGKAMATCELNFTEAREETLTAKSFNQPVLSDSLETLSRFYMEETGQALPGDTPPPVFHIAELLQS